MLTPDEDRYDERSYLKDAARAHKEYWVDQGRQYWPNLDNCAPTNWWKVLWVSLWVLVGCALFVWYAQSRVQPVHTGNVPAATIPSFQQYEAHPPKTTLVCPKPTVDPMTGMPSYVPAGC